MQLDTRIKFYEGQYRQFLTPLVPVVIRLDGRAFHTFCQNMKKPFDEDFHNIMVNVTERLVIETNARVGYTQSDEISLLLHSDQWDSQLYFHGNVNKINSIAASFTTAWFHCFLKVSPIAVGHSMIPTFDCRCFNVPVEEVANYFIWREQDAVRNSIQAAAQAHFSHKSLHGLNSSQLQDKLMREKGINWNDYPYYQKRGTYIRAVKTSEPITVEERESLPAKHLARTNPNLAVERRKMVFGEVPILTTIVNRTEFLLYGEAPVVKSGDENDQA